MESELPSLTSKGAGECLCSRGWLWDSFEAGPEGSVASRVPTNAHGLREYLEMGDQPELR